MASVISRKVSLTTLGCKLNQYDSEEIRAQFQQAGYDLTDQVAVADVCVVNTCAVTATAERKARTTVRSARRQNTEAVLLAVGCMAERTPATLASISGVDAVLGNREKQHILDFLPAARKSSPEVHVGETAGAHEVTGDVTVSGLWGRTRGYLKIQEGCSQKCTYCIIPRLRGTGRSLDVDTVVERAQVLASRGIAEVVLTGVALGTYGFDWGNRDGLALLLERLDKVKGLQRVRLGSVEPWAITDRTLDIISTSEKVCPHLHIPMQSGDDEVLHRMNRRYTTGQIRHIVEYAFARRTDWGFGSDIIVGFPGETDQQFRNTQRLIEDLPLAYVHIFPYSERPGTPAVKLPGGVSDPEKKERVGRLRRTERGKRLQFRRKHLDSVQSVLFEDRVVDGRLAGHTPNYLDVYAIADGAQAGRVRDVRITALHQNGVLGEIIASTENEL